MIMVIKFCSKLACVASVSARVRRERWDESKKKGMTGEEEGREVTVNDPNTLLSLIFARL